MSFLEERDLARLGREARGWLVSDRGEVARRGREAREWLLHDERGRVVGMIVLSVTVSIALSLIVTAIAGAVGRRCATTAAPADGAAEAPPAGASGEEGTAPAQETPDEAAVAGEAPAT